MRRDRELAFHAAEDPTPPDPHTVPDAAEPRDAARHVVAPARPKGPERLSDGIARSPPARDVEQVRAECGLDDGRGMSFGHAIGHRDIAEPPSLGRAGSLARPRPSTGPRLGLGPGMRSAPGPSRSAPDPAGPPRTRALRPV